MIRRAFGLPDGDRTVPVVAELFSDPRDLLSTIDSRTAWPSLARFHHLGGSPPYDPEWSGFSDPSELRDRLLNGVRDDGAVRRVALSADRAKASEERRLRTVGRDVSGGAVDVPAYLAGIPRDMLTIRRRRVPSRILNLCVDAGIGFANSAGDYRGVGEAVAAAVSALEAQGYRVAVTAVVSVHEDVAGGILVMGMPLKAEWEPMGSARVLYPMSDVSFFRGIGFSWLATCPDFNPANHSMGSEVQTAFAPDVADARVRDLYSRAFGGNAEFVAMRRMTEMSRRGMSEDALRGYVESMLTDVGERRIGRMMLLICIDNNNYQDYSQRLIYRKRHV